MAKYSEILKVIEDILSEDPMDEHIIYDVLFDDYGQCLHICFSGLTQLSTIEKIANSFGDADPSITVEGKYLKIIIINKRYELC